MSETTQITAKSTKEYLPKDTSTLQEMVLTLLGQIDDLQGQLHWLKRQMFGSKSERRFVDADGRQLSLGEWKQEDAPASGITVAEHQRRNRTVERDVGQAHAASSNSEFGIRNSELPPDHPSRANFCD